MPGNNVVLPIAAPAFPHIGLPDWKLLGQHYGQHQPVLETSNPVSDDHDGHRRHSERREKRQSSSRPKQNRGADSDKRRNEPLTHYYEESRRHRTSKRRQEVGNRQPQHEIEFVHESNKKLPKHPQNSHAGNNNNDHANNIKQTIVAENTLFSFPWKWKSGPGDDGPIKRPGDNGEEKPQDCNIWTEQSRKGVPSVVFAIHDTGDGTTTSRESRTPSPLSEPRRIRRYYHRRPREDVLQEDPAHFLSSPRTPIMAGNREDPIPCSESLKRSVSLHSESHGKGGGVTQKKPPQRIKTQSLQDQIEPLTTNHVQQGYTVTEGRHALESSKRYVGKDYIALPKLNVAGNTTASSNHYTFPTDVARDVTTNASPPLHIGGQIVYNLSESSQQQQDKVRAAITAHTASISESLEKMRNNLRNKQSLLSHAVFDLKAKQTEPETNPFSDRIWNCANASQPHPDRVPLLKNQNYISGIFSDIATKMTKQSEKQEGLRSTSRTREPYVPKVSTILHSMQHFDLENPSQVNARRKEDREGCAKAAPTGRLKPASAYRIPEVSQQRHDSHACSAREEITTIYVSDPCSVASPITEQLSAFLSPTPKSNSSLYIPNIQSQQGTPMRDKTIPFRASTAASPTTNQAVGPARPRLSPSPRIGLQGGDRKIILSATHDAYFHQTNEFWADESHACDAEMAPSAQTPKERQGVRGKHTIPRMHDNWDMEIRDVRSEFPSMQDIIEVTNQTSSLHFKEIVNLTDQWSRGPTVPSRSPHHDTIDVTSLPSSCLSKTTVKNIICVDEDSLGRIRLRKKLAAMPKRRRRRNSRGRTPTRTRGQRYFADNYEGLQSWNKSSYYKWAEQEPVAQEESLGDPAVDLMKGKLDDSLSLNDSQHDGRGYFLCNDDNNGDQMEEEIVFASCPDANKGLFDGIWDIDLPPPSVSKAVSKELTRTNLVSKNKSAIVPPLSLVEADRPKPSPINALELKGPLFMSPCSRESAENCKRTTADNNSGGRQPLQPPEVKEERQKLKSPMEASAQGPLAPSSTSLIRASSRVARTSSPQPQGNESGKFRTSGSSGNAASGIGKTSSGIGRTLSFQTPSGASGIAPPAPVAISTSPLTTKRLNRGRDPAVLAWAARRPKFTPLHHRRDAPISVVKQREPEGTVSVNPTLGNAMLSEEQDETEETVVPPTSKLPKIVRPTPVRRVSALSRKGQSCERSIETKSVTFHSGDTFLGPKGGNIPHVICADHQTVNTDISWQRNKTIRRNIHPWDKESQCSSHEAFHNLSTRDVPPEGDSEKRRTAAAIENLMRHERRRNRKKKSIRRSMYDEVLDAAAAEQVIILDDEASQRYEAIAVESPNHRKKQLWEEVSAMNRSYRSHGKNWETLGDSSVRETAQSKGDNMSSPSKARSKRSMQRDADDRREQAMFFDFLCF